MNKAWQSTKSNVWTGRRVSELVGYEAIGARGLLSYSPYCTCSWVFTQELSFLFWSPGVWRPGVSPPAWIRLANLWDLDCKHPISLPWLSMVTPISLTAHSFVWNSLLRPYRIWLYSERVLRSCKAEVCLFGGGECAGLGGSQWAEQAFFLFFFRL